MELPMPRQHLEQPSQPWQSAFTISLAVYNFPSDISSRFTYRFMLAPHFCAALCAYQACGCSTDTDSFTLVLLAFLSYAAQVLPDAFVISPYPSLAIISLSSFRQIVMSYTPQAGRSPGKAMFLNPTKRGLFSTLPGLPDGSVCYQLLQSAILLLSHIENTAMALLSLSHIKFLLR